MNAATGVGLRFSLELPTHRVEHAAEFVTAAAITEITQAAEAAGFAAVNLTDHPAPDTRWLDNGGHHALDPFVGLAFAAAASPVVKLQTNIYVAAYRNPFLGAKMVQTLDVLSGGRLILGVAAGYLKPEFGAVGVDFDQRGELLDEALEVLDAVLGGGDVEWKGSSFTARGVRLRPMTPSGRRPPVWVGGNSKPALRRAARYEGWAPFFTGGYARASRTAVMEAASDLAAGASFVRSLLAPGQTFDICWSDPTVGNTALSVDERCSRLSVLRDIGMTWAVVSVPAATRAEFLAGVEAFGRDIIAQKENT